MKPENLPDGMPAFELRGVTRSFGPKQALRGITASAAQGKAIGLLGRNGEGKSTLFKIMLDILEADAGHVEVLGMRADGSGSIRQYVGYVPERPTFHAFMTVAEVFAFRAKLYRGWEQERALAVAKSVGLDVATKIRGASKGTLAKAAWACAAAHDPALFLLDEPTSGLDALVRDDILGQLIGELHESGKTIVVSNHRMEELAGVLDEVWVLSEGVIASAYEVEKLRAGACRVTGRLKEGVAMPPGLPAVVLRSEGRMVEWGVFESPAADELCASGILTDVARAPLPLETAMRLLLKQAEGNAHA